MQLDGAVPRPRDRVLGGERVELDPEPETATDCVAEAIPLDIVYQDDLLLVINKPAGLVVHPAAGNPQGTLQNGLLHFDPSLAALPRAGLVHRIDKDTTGLLLVARTLQAHTSLVRQLQAREISRQYLALCHGKITAGGSIDAPIGRHAVDRKRYAVTESGRHAVTHYRVVERFRLHTLVRVRLETGRTHQIRVHMAHLRFPLLGDPVYGGRFRIPSGCGEAALHFLRSFRRQALHAERLGLKHPASGEYCEWDAPLPDDMNQLIEVVRSL